MRRYALTGMMLLVLVGFCVAGCATNPAKTGAEAIVTLEQIPSPDKSIFGLHLSSEDGRLVLDGRVRRRNPSSAGGAGHIDIAVIGPKGDLIKQVSAPYVPRIIPNKQPRGLRGSHFEVGLPTNLPAGSTIRVGHHAQAASNVHMADCGDNVAVPNG